MGGGKMSQIPFLFCIAARQLHFFDNHFSSTFLLPFFIYFLFCFLVELVLLRAWSHLRRVANFPGLYWAYGVLWIWMDVLGKDWHLFCVCGDNSSFYSLCCPLPSRGT
ncbi:hypothetical protein M434DRAFT_371607 [Hypoxylon sp. CO27-5]|nr:hypothetical protein M434DRAFT_371607 [Hypoxylon sp. CO27-5]